MSTVTDWIGVEIDPATLPALLIDLLGNPTLRNGHRWRWNRRGSLLIDVAGPRAGHVHSFESGRSFGLIALVAQVKGCSQEQARRWIAGRAPELDGVVVPVSSGPDKAVVMRRAAKLWGEAPPCRADHPYLVRKRMRGAGLRQLGQDLLVPIQDLSGAVVAWERIAPSGAKRYPWRGSIGGNFHLIGREPAAVAGLDRVIICEGVATGDSIREATSATVIAAMNAGNLQRVAASIREACPHADIIIVADNDSQPGKRKNTGVIAGLNAARAARARIAWPDMPGDANDLFVSHGAAAVFALVDRARYPAPPRATYPPAHMTPDEARAALDRELTAFLAQARRVWSGEGERVLRRAIQVDVGLGKTSLAEQRIVDAILAGWLGEKKVVVSVPRHNLGQEVVSAIENMGVTAAAWRGYGADDPLAPGEKMCLDLKAVEDALAADQDVQTSVCRAVVDGVERVCPFYWSCGYQRQRAEVKDARVIVVPHDSLFSAKPAAIGDVGLLVIDEYFVDAGLRGTDARSWIALDALEPGDVACYRSDGDLDVGATADLRALRVRLVAALREGKSDLDAEACRVGAALEQKRRRRIGIVPGMPAPERSRLVSDYRVSVRPSLAAALWRIIGAAIERGEEPAGVEIGPRRTEGGEVMAATLFWRADIRDQWLAGAPVLLLDATMQPELVEPFLPGVTFSAPVRARTPHVHLRQIIGAPVSSGRIMDHLDELRAFVCLRSRDAGKTLLVAQQRVADALREMGLPANVEAVHFNALSGIDRWHDVGLLIAIGRTMPPPVEVDRMAVALNGRMPAEVLDHWYDPIERLIEPRSGTAVVVQGERHPDVVAEAFRWRICEGELVQAIGRGRGVNRTAANPLEVELVSDVVLPLEVTEVAAWSDAKPNRADLMQLAGVSLQCRAHRALAFPELWSSRNAAIDDEESARWPVGDGWKEAAYQAGDGGKVERMLFDPSAISDPRAWLEARLGPLRNFAVVAGADELLRDVRAVIEDSGERRLHVSAILAGLNAMPGRPWASWAFGRTGEMKLAEELGKFGVESRRWRSRGERVSGYTLDDIEAAPRR